MFSLVKFIVSRLYIFTPRYCCFPCRILLPLLWSRLMQTLSHCKFTEQFFCSVCWHVVDMLQVENEKWAALVRKILEHSRVHNFFYIILVHSIKLFTIYWYSVMYRILPASFLTLILYQLVLFKVKVMNTIQTMCRPTVTWQSAYTWSTVGWQLVNGHLSMTEKEVAKINISASKKLTKNKKAKTFVLCWTRGMGSVLVCRSMHYWCFVWIGFFAWPVFNARFTTCLKLFCFVVNLKDIFNCVG